MLIDGDSFDVYGTTASLLTEGIYTSATGVTLSASNPRTGTYSARADVAGLLRKAVTSGTVFGVGCAFDLSALPTADQAMGLVSFRDSTNTNQISLWVTTTGTVEVRSGDYDGTVLGETRILFEAGTYGYIETWVYCHPTDGFVRIGFGDSSSRNYNVLNLVDIDTDTTGTGEITYIGVFNRRTADAAVFDCDDLAVYDNSGSYDNVPFVGNSSVYEMPPTADTATADWAKSTGTDGYALVDDVPPNDSAYISSTTLNAKSTFTLGNVSTSLYRVRGVIVYSRQKKTSGTTSTQINIINDGYTAAGTARDVTTSFAYYKDVFPTNPATSGVWTVTSLNTATIQAKKIV